jgi:hypothetical protein
MMQECPNCGRYMRLITATLGDYCKCPDCGTRHRTPGKWSEPYWKCDNCQGRVAAPYILTMGNLIRGDLPA